MKIEERDFWERFRNSDVIFIPVYFHGEFVYGHDQSDNAVRHHRNNEWDLIEADAAREINRLKNALAMARSENLHLRELIG